MYSPWFVLAIVALAAIAAIVWLCRETLVRVAAGVAAQRAAWGNPQPPAAAGSSRTRGGYFQPLPGGGWAYQVYEPDTSAVAPVGAGSGGVTVPVMLTFGAVAVPTPPPVPAPPAVPPAPMIGQPGGPMTAVVVTVPAGVSHLGWHTGGGYGAPIAVASGPWSPPVPVAPGQTITVRLSADGVNWGPEATLVVA